MTEAVEGVLVTEVTEGSPAQKAGLLKGDILVKVQGEATHGLTIKEFMNKLNRHPHPQVKMRIQRSQQEFDVVLMREMLQGKTVEVKSQTVVNHTGQLISVKLEDFDSGASQIFLTALHEAFKKGPVSGVVLDLRGNPGGYVYEALQILRVFLSKQPVIVYQNKGQTVNVSLGGGHPTLDIPLIVLVNEGSASASELVSGALQSEKRAIVMGVPTFGKGTAHSVVIGDYGGMQLTQNFFHFTNGESPQLKGVKPDIRIQRKENRRRSASDLKYALPEQKIFALDRSEFADLQREKLFDSIKQALKKRSEQRQKAGLEQLDKSIDPELSEAFRVLREWAELLKVLTPALPQAS
jgi:carboxyl-terminal processing protease